MIFLYFLLPRYGMNGYFISFLVTHLINFLLSIRRLLKITVKRIPAHIPLIAVSSIGFGIWTSGYLGHLPARCCAYLLILGSLLYLSGIVSREDFRWLQGLIYKK